VRERERKILQSRQLALDVYWLLSEGIKAFYSVLEWRCAFGGELKKERTVGGVGGA
jgi:hypothetical protein